MILFIFFILHPNVEIKETKSLLYFAVSFQQLYILATLLLFHTEIYDMPFLPLSKKKVVCLVAVCSGVWDLH